MMTNFTKLKMAALFSILALFLSVNVYAQPANDDCADAVELTIGADEANYTTEDGNTVGGTGSSSPATVCSGTWFGDDIWFSVTTPASIPDGALIIRTEFGTMSGDVPAVGMAIYEGCANDALPLACFSNGDGALDELKIFNGNLAPNTSYSIRIWSGGSPTDDSGTFRVGAFWEPPSSDVVIWGANPGEGDFDGGMNGWTMQSVSGDTAVWEYEACSCTNGTFRSTTISSPTSFNGAMTFDADSINTPGGNPPPGPPYPQLEGELISPTIDLSSVSAASLKFFHAYAPLNGDAYFAYSTDDGATWSEDIEVAEEIAPNALSPVPHEQRFFLPEIAGQSQVRVKFIFRGDFYYWIIDDVQIIEPEDNNLVVMDNFYAIAPNAMTPSSQVEEFSFLADIANIGAAPQPNTNLNISIVDETTSAVVYTEDLSYGTTEADSLYENAPFAGCFEPDGSLTTYTGTYTISSDSVDFDPTNNQQSFSFMVTDSVFAKEMGITRTIVPAAANWDDGEPHSWAYGNFFHIVNGTDAADEDNQWYGGAAQFGIGNAGDLVGVLLSVYLYEWTEDTNNDGNMDSDERVQVGFNIYEIDGTEPADALITVPLTPFPSGNEGEVPLTSGSDYVLMVEYQTSTTDDFVMLGAEPWDYAAQTFRTDPNEFGDKPWRPAEMLGVNGDLTTEPYSSAGFTGTVVPSVRLSLSKRIVISTNELDAANIVEVSPNPATDFINLNVDLVNAQDQVQVQIMDAAGKTLFSTVHDNVSQETFKYNVSNYPAGLYIMSFITEEGARTKRFIVQR